MFILAIGASRNIGYFSALRFLERGDTVTFLVRSPTIFELDEKIQGYIQSGKAKVATGDALKEEDVKKAWNECLKSQDGKIDLVVYSVGGTPSFSVTKGFTIDPPTLCTTSMLNVIATYPSENPPRLIIISSTGLGQKSHDALPLVWKPLYGYLLDAPHKDKLGMERILYHAAGRTWTEKDPLPEILPKGWEARVPRQGWLKSVVIRPALLTDGEGSGKYRVDEKEIPGAYTIRRKDVAHFLVEGVAQSWEKWEGKTVNAAY